MTNFQLLKLAFAILSFSSLLFLVYVIKTVEKRDNENKIEIASFAIVFFVFVSIIMQLWEFLENPEVTVLERVRTIAPIFTGSLATLAFLIGYLNYKRKSGIHLSFDIATVSDNVTDETYIKRIMFQNEKDKTVAIWEIYIVLGKFPIRIKSYLGRDNSKPLLIKGYECEVIELDEEYYKFSYIEPETQVILKNITIEDLKIKIITNHGIFNLQPIKRLVFDKNMGDKQHTIEPCMTKLQQSCEVRGSKKL